MKKNLKKISAMFLAAMMVIGTVGCGASSGERIRGSDK